MIIKDLGRWDSLEMVQRYTRSVTFEDSLKHYNGAIVIAAVVCEGVVSETTSHLIRI